MSALTIALIVVGVIAGLFVLRWLAGFALGLIAFRRIRRMQDEMLAGFPADFPGVRL